MYLSFEHITLSLWHHTSWFDLILRPSYFKSWMLFVFLLCTYIFSLESCDARQNMVSKALSHWLSRKIFGKGQKFHWSCVGFFHKQVAKFKGLRRNRVAFEGWVNDSPEVSWLQHWGRSIPERNAGGWTW